MLTKNEGSGPLRDFVSPDRNREPNPRLLTLKQREIALLASGTLQWVGIWLESGQKDQHPSHTGGRLADLG